MATQTDTLARTYATSLYELADEGGRGAVLLGERVEQVGVAADRERWQAARGQRERERSETGGVR